MGTLAATLGQVKIKEEFRFVNGNIGALKLSGMENIRPVITREYLHMAGCIGMAVMVHLSRILKFISLSM